MNLPEPKSPIQHPLAWVAAQQVEYRVGQHLEPDHTGFHVVRIGGQSAEPLEGAAVEDAAGGRYR